MRDMTSKSPVRSTNTKLNSSLTPQMSAPPAVMSNPSSETFTVPAIAGFPISECLKLSTGTGFVFVEFKVDF